MAKATRTADATPFAGLQEEIIIWEILVRLPPKPLLRCRAVCRAWRRLLTTHAFLLAHHRHQPSLPLVSGFQHGGTMYQDILTLDRRAADPATKLLPVARLSDATLIVHASCDGLLILSIQCVFFSICNPVTREEASLDLISGFDFLGLYPHHPTGEYRLLLDRQVELMHEDQIPGPRGAYYVFSLGRGLPRCIGSLSSERPQCSGTPVLLRGCLHWNPVQNQSGGGGMITVFNTESESFRRMRAPIFVSDSYFGSDVYTCLFEMDSTLGMFNCNDGKLQRIDIWALQDYEKEVWKLRYQVELPMSEIWQKFDGCGDWHAMAVSEEGSVLVLVHGHRWLLHVDTKGKLQASFHRDGQDLMISSGMIKQSLVRHAFFPELNGYVVNGSTFIRCQ